MDILLLNQEWFKPELIALGHNVVTASIRGHCDILIPGPLTPLELLLEKAPTGFKPECIIIHDESSPFYVSDLFTQDIPVLFYSVDTHHHHTCHLYSSMCLTHTFVAQSDYLDSFILKGISADWLPLWASKYYEPSDIKKYEAIFIGTMDPNLNPERVTFINALKERVPVHTAMGAFWEYYPQSKVVLNQTVKSDLNFRVFEALMSGTVLLTELSTNGLLELFDDGVDLVTYQKNNVEDACEKIKNLLNNPALANKIGNAGRDKVLAKHLALHRADHVNEIILKSVGQKKIVRYLAQIPNQVWLIKKLKEQNHCDIINALNNAIQTIKAGLANNESMDEELAQYIIHSCIEHDCLTASNVGRTLLNELEEHYIDIGMFKLARIWTLLNNGSISEAKRIANDISAIPTEELFEKVNTMMNGIIGIK